METLQQRFQHCDPRFGPYLERAMARLPLEARDNLLADRGFQFVAGDDFHEACVLRQSYDTPVRCLVYLNTRLLKEAEHRILLAIVSEIAFYLCGRENPDADCREVETKLRDWGFGELLDAVACDLAVAGTPNFKSGYDWAKRQSVDYLRQHFGLYYDRWNRTGWDKASVEAVKMAVSHSATSSLLEEIQKLHHPSTEAARPGPAVEGISPRQAILAGIMTALKEAEIREARAPRVCRIGTN
jgi:hypothetical protein